ncbi:hypothetical protein IJ707_05410 [bacterium]|nr:hypothetical protein [bacterium]
MEYVDLIVTIFETIFGLAALGSIIYAASSAFGIKGFVASTGGIAALVLGIHYFEKFLDYAMNNAPVLIIIMLAFMAVTLIWILIYSTMQKFKEFGKTQEGLQKRNQFIITCLKQAGMLVVCIIGGILIFILVFFIATLN